MPYAYASMMPDTEHRNQVCGGDGGLTAPNLKLKTA